LVFEYIATILAVATGIAGAAAFIYKRGHIDGIDSACEQRIKEDIRGLKESVDDMGRDKDEAHKEIFTKISDVDSKVDQIKGSVDVMKDLLNGHLTQNR
jgi:hypothetical protein